MSDLVVPRRVIENQYVLWPAAAALVGFLLALSGVLLAAALGDPPQVVLKDVATIFRTPFYAGAVSHLGVMLMVATAAVCGFSALLSHELRPLLITVCCFSAFSAFDDMFLFHELVAPYHLGIPQWVVVLGYPVVGALIFAMVVLRLGIAAALGLSVSLFCLAASVIVDQLPHAPAGGDGERKHWLRDAAEDVAKTAGFAAWFGFWVYQCFELLRRR